MGSISKIIQEKLLKEDYLSLEKAIRTGNETAKEEMKLLSSAKSQCTRQNSRVPSSHTRGTGLWLTQPAPKV